jgi:hypothetical protein
MGSYAVVVFALLVFSGLLRPLGPKARTLRRYAAFQPRRDPSPDPAGATPVSLNSIELGLIAELNLEMAEANEAVAQDVTQRPETRRVASEAANTWRERARLFHMQAQRQGARPIVPGPRPVHQAGLAYTGLERRREVRRTQTRRTGGPVLDARDRRIGPDRRGRDRRRPGAAPGSAAVNR